MPEQVEHNATNHEKLKELILGLVTYGIMLMESTQTIILPSAIVRKPINLLIKSEIVSEISFNVIF